ncbi:MAG: hypothetical protein ACR2OT_04210 [Parvibaculales bacterium]
MFSDISLSAVSTIIYLCIIGLAFYVALWAARWLDYALYWVRQRRKPK